MFFNGLEFFITEAWNGFRRSGIMSVVSIGIITVSLVIFGSFLLAIVNLGNIVSNVSSRMEVVAYVNRNLDLLEASSLQVKLSGIAGVDSVTYRSKSEAWEQFKVDLGQKLNIEDVVAGNPLPNTLIIEVKTPDLVSKVAETVSKMKEFDEVRFSGVLVERLSVFANAVRLGGLLITLLLSFGTLLIVVNTIRLTVLAREADIYIMKLVGATDSFIKWPFIIEGVLMGFIGSIFSILILFFSYSTLSIELSQALPFLPLIVDNRELLAIYLIVGVTGTLLGMLGGYISVSKSLKE
ncbi:MAG: permease-like cell division protein FtsX [Candidatus Saganbacteria bacterium]|jgi:cell division transport system permease protein|nr:permease-like cell division protein FtsX [Candidatus Saganbacteria bacterium]